MKRLVLKSGWHALGNFSLIYEEVFRLEPECREVRVLPQGGISSKGGYCAS